MVRLTYNFCHVALAHGLKRISISDKELQRVQCWIQKT